MVKETNAAPLHVLIVDDSPDAREALRAPLMAWGNRVDVARDAAEGIERALATRPDVALVDIGLPDADGHEVARRLRGHGIRLVALTGFTGAADRDRALEAGFDAFLAKPVEPDDLERLLAASGDQPPSAPSRNGSSGA